MKHLPQTVAVGVSPQAVPAASRRKDSPARYSWPAILLGCATMCSAEPAVESAQENQFYNIRVTVEYIEVSHQTVTRIMLSEDADSGPKLHARMRTLVKAGKARIIETSILTCRAGQRARSRSIMEYMYPMEYDPEDHKWSSVPQPTDDSTLPIFKIPPRPSSALPSSSTRYVGVHLEVEPLMGPDLTIVDLRLAPEIVDLLQLDTHMEFRDEWGDASLRTPRFESIRTSTRITLEDGKFGFVGVLTPTRKGGGADTSRKIMLFARADIVTVGP